MIYQWQQDKAEKGWERLVGAFSPGFLCYSRRWEIAMVIKVGETRNWWDYGGVSDTFPCKGASSSREIALGLSPVKGITGFGDQRPGFKPWLLKFLIFFFLLVIHFIHISVYMSIPTSQFITPLAPPLVVFSPWCPYVFFSTSVSQFLLCKPVHLYHFLGSTYMC